MSNFKLTLSNTEDMDFKHNSPRESVTLSQISVHTEYSFNFDLESPLEF